MKVWSCSLCKALFFSMHGWNLKHPPPPALLVSSSYCMKLVQAWVGWQPQCTKKWIRTSAVPGDMLRGHPRPRVVKNAWTCWTSVGAWPSYMPQTRACIMQSSGHRSIWKTGKPVRKERRKKDVKYVMLCTLLAIKTEMCSQTMSLFRIRSFMSLTKENECVQQNYMITICKSIQKRINSNNNDYSYNDNTDKSWESKNKFCLKL